MQGSQRKRRGKGISLSVPPQKNNHPNEQRPASTPKNSFIQLQQSVVQVGDYIHQPLNNARRLSAVHVKPNVVFHYSNVSKEQQEQESERLNREMQYLGRELMEKRTKVSQIRNQSLKNSEQPKYESSEKQIIKKSVKINEKPPQKSPRKKEASPPKKEKLSPPKPSKEKMFVQESRVEMIENGREIKEKRKQLSTERGKRKIEQAKQNQTISEQKMAKLKWAEEKLLDIIRVCDQGL